MGLFSGIGNIVNDVFGASQSMQQTFENQKYFAENAHQLEVKDLEKAGYNPALTTGGSGASASGGGGGASGDPFGSLSTMINAFSSAKQADADATLKKAQAVGVAKENGWIDQKAQQGLKESASREAMNLASSATQGMEQKKKAEEIRQMKGGKTAQWIGTDPMSNLQNVGDSLANWASNQINTFKSIFKK